MSGKPSILLVNPPCDVLSNKLTRASFPLGMCYLGTYLENLGYSIRLVDTQIENTARTRVNNQGIVRIGTPMEKIAELIEDFQPDILGISCSFHTNFNPMLDLAELAKTRCAVSHVIVGGCYASVVPERVMKCRYIDYLVIGEGETTSHQLLQKLESGQPFDLAGLDGFAYRDGRNNVIVNSKAKFLAPDKIFTPNRNLLPVEKYINLNRPHSILTKGKRVLEVLTSRGCNANCTFCSGPLLHGKFRGREPKDVVEELSQLKQQYDIDEVQFVDDNLTMDKKRAERIFRLMIEERLNLHWCTPNGIALYSLDDNLIRLMKQSGCYMVALPIESGSQYVLSKLIKKPLNLNNVPPLVKTFKRHKISMEVFLVIGMPGETLDHINETFDFIQRLGIFRVHFNYAMPIPSTPLYLQYRRLKDKYPSQAGEIDGGEERYFDYRIPQISTAEWTNYQLKRFVSNKVLLFYAKFMFTRPHVFFLEIARIAPNLGLFKEIARYYLNYVFKK